jgi:predicted small secreted protein
MKNTRNLLIALSLLAFLTIACSTIKSLSGSGSSSSGNSVSSDGTVLDTAKTGIPECDALIEKVEAKASDKNNNSSMFERAAYQFIKDQIIQPIRDDIANKTAADKKKLAEKCTDAMHRLDQQEDKK